MESPKPKDSASSKGSRHHAAAIRTPTREDSQEDVVMIEDKDYRILGQGTPSASTSSTQSSENMDDLSHPFPHLELFYGPVLAKKKVMEKGKEHLKGSLRCKKCMTKVSFNTYSMFTLKSHYQRVHHKYYKDLLAAIGGGSKRGRSLSASPGTTKRMHQISIESSFAESSPLNYIKAEELFYRYMIAEMLPANNTESPDLAAFLKLLNPQFKLPSRRTYMRTLNKKAEVWKDELTAMMDAVKYIATTADCWTAHNRSFLGMTAHWIDPSNLTRKNAVLACLELPVAHVFDVLANTMQDVHQKFHIQAKVTCTTTDNGSNFVKAFRVFGDSSNDPAGAIDAQDVDEDTDEREEVQPVDMSQLMEEDLSLMAGDGGDTSTYRLPNHHRCAAHTLNLLATVDVEKVPMWSTGVRPCFTKVKAKAQALWNKQNRKPVTAATIKRELGRKLKTPNITRWNSMYDSMQVLSEQLDTKITQINMICLNNNISSFTPTDNDIIKEYLTVMKPIVNSLDRLQSEREAYMGVLLPTLYVLCKKLEGMRSKPLQYAKPLLEYLLEHPQSEEKKPKGFIARFSALFSNMDFLMATGIHPFFKLPVVRLMNPDKVDETRTRLLDEIQYLAATGTSGSSSTDEAEDDFFKELRTLGPPPIETASSSSHHLNKLTKVLDSWSREKEKSTKVLEHGMFPNLNRDAWVDVFMRYNTAIPSSAAVERLFSQGSDIMKSKRASMTSENFERLVFMKGNLNLLKLNLDRVPEDS